MKNFKKFLAVVLALVMVATVFAACGGNKDKEDPAKTELKRSINYLRPPTNYKQAQIYFALSSVKMNSVPTPSVLITLIFWL